MNSFIRNGRRIVVKPRSSPVSTLECPWHCYTSRSSSSSSKRHQEFQTSSKDPFRVLGIPPGSSYASAKEAFVKLALEYHPDKQRQSSKEKNEDSSKNRSGDNTIFIRIRQAFEVIREGSDGQAEVTTEAQWTDEELREFMEEQTNDFLSFQMDHDTRKEVIAAFENLSPGGLDRGGSWQMARMLAEREKCQLENAKPRPKELSAGASSRVQRRRRR